MGIIRQRCIPISHLPYNHDTMASARAAAPILSHALCRQCFKATPRSSFVTSVTRPKFYQPRAIRPSYASIRWHSTPASDSKVYDFKQVQRIIEEPSNDLLLIGIEIPTVPSYINHITNWMQMFASLRRYRKAIYQQQSISRSSHNLMP